MSTLERAIAIAAEAHASQDKFGQPYIFHPLRVMMALKTTEERIAGVLHDVVEKNPAWTLSALRAEGFSEKILSAVDAVTRREEEDEETFLQRASADEIGRAVKFADLTDNLRTARAMPQTDKIQKKIAKYEKAEAFFLHVNEAGKASVMTRIEAQRLTDEELEGYDRMMVECVLMIENFAALASAVWSDVLKELDRRGKVSLVSGSYDNPGEALIQRLTGLKPAGDSPKKA